LKTDACGTFVQEPPTAKTKLLELENFSVTPHIGGNAVEPLENTGTLVVDEVLNVLAGNPPYQPVPKKKKGRKKSKDFF